MKVPFFCGYTVMSQDLSFKIKLKLVNSFGWSRCQTLPFLKACLCWRWAVRAQRLWSDVSLLWYPDSTLYGKNSLWDQMGDENELFVFQKYKSPLQRGHMEFERCWYLPHRDLKPYSGLNVGISASAAKILAILSFISPPALKNVQY